MTRLLDVARQRLRSLFRRERADRELDRELRNHVDAHVDELVAGGMAPDEARRIALSTFGGFERVREDARDARGVSVMENIGRDLRYALRGLRREPMLLLAATVSIAVGAGGNLAVFSLAREFMFSTPDVRRPEELVQFQVSHGSHASFQRWRDLNESGSLSAITGYSVEKEINWRQGDVTSSIIPMIVTDNFFDVTGVPLAFGRGFTAAEARAELDPRMAVVSHSFWQTRLGADSAILGRSLMLNGDSYVVLGVLAPGLRSVAGFSISPGVYLPLNRTLVPEMSTSSGIVRLIGRLKPDQTMDQGRAAVDAADRRFGRLAGDSVYAGVQVIDRIGSISGASGPKSKRMLGGFFALLGLVSFMVLLIACANVAGLLIARGTRRRQEIAIRLAIGGSRSRLVQQFLVEGFWLAFIGTATGLLLCMIFMRLINGITLPVPMPIVLQLSLDPAMLVASVAVVFVVILLCGIFPALGATRFSLVPALKREAPFRAARRVTARGALLTTQVTVSTVLLVTAFLFVRNLSRAQVTDPGFEVERALVAQIGFVHGRADSNQMALLQRAVERVAALPGVEAAAYSGAVPLTMHSGSSNGRMVRIDDADQTKHVQFSRLLVGPDFFSTLNVRVIGGREFTVADVPGAPNAIVVNEEFSRRYLEGRNPVGSRLRFDDETVIYEVVGEVESGKYQTLGEEPRPAMFLPVRQHGIGQGVGFVLIRTRTESVNLSEQVREAIGSLDGSIAVQVEPMRKALRLALLPSQIGAAILGTLGALGLILASFGLYALVAYNVSRRTSEIAIRSALGATRGTILRLVVGDAAALVGGGVLIGLALAAFVTAPLSTFLAAGMSSRDPVSFGGTFVVFMLVAVLASWLPARQATKVAPVTAMRLD
jgi:putative ABC transport system permease protein